MTHKQYFLGANTPAGFRSYFGSACPVSDGWNIYVIKGGPGSGKSTLMRRVGREAAERELTYEHIFCSSDPDSLDGVIIPELKAAIFDGTAPHVLEPAYPGACEHIVNVGDAWSKARLQAQRDEIIALSSACSAHHAQAMRFLGCADSFRQNTALTAASGLDKHRVHSTAVRLAAKYCGKPRTRQGSESTRLISAVTPKGILTFADSVEAECDRIVPIIDRCYTPSALLMDELRALLLDQGLDITVCRCSQNPERIEHIIVPAPGIAFTVCSDVHSDIAATERAVHTERFLSEDIITGSKQRFSFNRKSAASFIDLAADEMKRAKSVHDQLEQCYISAMDFDAVDDIAQKVCRDMFRG